MSRRLPRATDQLAGLRAARWVRESTAGQFDRYGPDAQREQQDRAIERYELVDTGLTWTVAHSGRTVAATPEFAAMIAAAGVEYDVLLVGYVSRFARDLRTAVNARHDLHLAGAAILFCDELVLTSDEDRWDTWAREAVEAESYSRRLGRRIAEGYAAKFRRLGDQAGNPTLGLRRSIEPPHVLELDPATIGRAVEVFEAYALGNVSTADLAERVGLGEEQVRKMLRNPIYNGWAVRHRGEDRAPAPWRSDPPVDDALWERVQAVRVGHTRGGGPRRVRPDDALLGLLWCSCGRRIRADGMMGAGTSQRRARMHPEPCEAWGPQTRYAAETWEAPIAAQLAGLRLDQETAERVRRALAAPEPAPILASPARWRRAMRELSDDHLAGRLTDEAYLARLGELRRQAAEAQPELVDRASVDDAMVYVRDLAQLVAKATPEELAELVRAIYAKVEVEGPRFVGVTLTPSAYAHGLALALPESVRLAKRPRQEPGLAYQPTRIPIVGRREWLAAARRTA